MLNMRILGTIEPHLPLNFPSHLLVLIGCNGNEGRLRKCEGKMDRCNIVTWTFVHFLYVNSGLKFLHRN